MSLRNKTILVTAGPTREWIDPVRYLSNASSGKQGYAIAAALAAHGAKVLLVSGPVTLFAPEGVERIDVETAEEMFGAVQHRLPVDVAVCTAAVSDFRPSRQSVQKIKRDSRKNLSLELTATPDILGYLGKLTRSRPQLVIGFALESENVLENARKKLTGKNCDWIFANEVGNMGAVFGSEKNRVHWVSRDKEEVWPEMKKREIGEKIAVAIENYFNQQNQKQERTA